VSGGAGCAGCNFVNRRAAAVVAVQQMHRAGSRRARLAAPRLLTMLLTTACRAPTRRVAGNMAVLSGGAGMRYMEYSTQPGGAGRGGRGRPPGPGKLAKMAKRYG
jgi:hypothetical protein